MLRPAAFCVATLLVTGAVTAQPPPRCLPPFDMTFSAELVLDLAAARAACGHDEPAVLAAAQAFAQDVANAAARMMDSDYVAWLRLDQANFLEARRRRYGNGADLACRETPQLAQSAEATLALLQQLRQMLGQATAPGGPWSQAECREP